ncbi:MAG: glutamine synthetase [Oligoflexia bacterium]|nr:glutamine synthetase [Oligoflexia bacterium]
MGQKERHSHSKSNCNCDKNQCGGHNNGSSFHNGGGHHRESNLNELSLPLILDKNPRDFTREDFLHLIEYLDIKQLNFHYNGLDGQLKELKIPVNSLEYADLVLAQGERIDGSSIFKGVIDTSKSDLYIVPIYRFAFLSPFEKNTLSFMCTFLDRDGGLTEASPDNVLLKAHQDFKKQTKLELNALGELEFYLLYDKETNRFPNTPQNAYHQTTPFSKKGHIINHMMKIISSLTCAVKYSHAEVGFIPEVNSIYPEINGKVAEQFEIEFLPRPIYDMGVYLNLSKWIIKNVAYLYGANVTFTPKLQEGMAGTGLHIHLELKKDGKNIMVDPKTKVLSKEARHMIVGLCSKAKSLTAFGNTVASSYMRLVPHQEAPTRICWSEQNRSALIRVPLGWGDLLSANLADLVNNSVDKNFQNKPKKEAKKEAKNKKTDKKIKEQKNSDENDNFKNNSRQTIEIRSPDGSANINLLLAGISVAIREGMSDPYAEDTANKLHVVGNIFNNEELKNSLDTLPVNCLESANVLKDDRAIYEKHGIFPTKMIDYTINKLRQEIDPTEDQKYKHSSKEEQLEIFSKVLHKDFHK